MNRELYLARKIKGFSQKEFAQKIAMDQTTYSRKENGKNLITEDEWQRMARTLNLEVEDIKPEKPIVIKNENCTFNDQSVGVKYVALPEDVLDTIMKYTKRLECELEQLKSNQNDNQESI